MVKRRAVWFSHSAAYMGVGVCGFFRGGGAGAGCDVMSVVMPQGAAVTPAGGIFMGHWHTLNVDCKDVIALH